MFSRIPQPAFKHTRSLYLCLRHTHSKMMIATSSKCCSALTLSSSTRGRAICVSRRALGVVAYKDDKAAEKQQQGQEHKSSKNEEPRFPFSRPHGSTPPKEYAQLRSKCPIAKARLFDNSPIWLLTKMDDVKEVLKDDRFSKVRTHPGFPELSAGAKEAISGREATFVDMDPPEHTKFRGMFEHAFTNERVDAMRPSIDAKVNELIDDMMKLGAPLDLAENFSLPIAFKVIYEILGIPFEDFNFLSDNVAVRASGSSTARDAAAAQEALTDYMQRLVADKEKNPSADLISDVIKQQLKPGHITQDQLVAHAFLLLVAGNATVASMINLGVVTLLQHPDQLEALKEDPSLWPAAVDEICRYHTASAYALRRVAVQDVHLKDVSIKSGEGIIALNQSANRDEDVFEHPDRFDIRRQRKPNVAYGSGTHVCIGEYLSLVELESAFKGLFTRLPNLKVAVPFDELEYSAPDKDVGLARLPVVW